ncbi:hypothetical protein QBC42DRAFT_301860 [Cladorrhinum samala]|uniref:Uncharacterized protein n=1 Tax=Cladorrhinum samala TaxID=585594 RepID=A0AAV9H838_9PEZI|nr:hypothetical protein QBC42DRAFT_301860 [Cladorrhinum samala]
MSSTNFALQVQDAIPVVSEQMQILYQALKDDETMLELAFLRDWMADDLEEQTLQAQLQGFSLSTSSTVATLRNEEKIITRLIMAMPRDLIMSLVRHTIAYDRSRPQAGDDRIQYSTYTNTEKGVYAASIHIEDRGGRFLTRNEIKKLVKCLNTYADAVELWKVNERWDAGVQAHTAGKAYVASLDQIYASAAAQPGGKPRFGSGVGGVNKIRALVRVFEQYVYAQTPNPPHVQVPFKQCPLMIGCTSTSILHRCKQHQIPSSGAGFHSTTWTWELTLCILKHLQMKARVCTVPILLTVEKEELPIAERLVTTLAQSLVTQMGFNIIEGGGQGDYSDSDARTAAYRAVYGYFPWYRQQQEEATERLEAKEKIIEAVDAVEDLNGVEAPAVEVEMKALEISAKEISQEMDFADRAMDEIYVTQGRLDTIEAMQRLSKKRRETDSVFKTLREKLKQIQIREKGGAAQSEGSTSQTAGYDSHRGEDDDSPDDSPEDEADQDENSESLGDDESAEDE